MQIELMGCTSAGKTTLVSRICRACRGTEIDVATSDGVVLGALRLDALKSRLARTLIIDLVAGAACMLVLPWHWRFFSFALRTIFRLRTGWFEKLNLARNVLKKIGVHVAIGWLAPPSRVVLVDEGTLHAVHNLFVHLNSTPNQNDFRIFARLVPLPDAAVYLRESVATLMARTLLRGHPRLRGARASDVKLFVERAVSAFERLEAEEAIHGILLVADAQKETLSYKAGAGMPPGVGLAARLVTMALLPRAMSYSPVEDQGSRGSDVPGLSAPVSVL